MELFLGRLSIWIIFTLGLMVRVVAGIFLWDSTYPDELSYWQLGSQICQGLGYTSKSDGLDGFLRAGEPTAYWGALVPAASAAFQRLFGDHLQWARLLFGLVSYIGVFAGVRIYVNASQFGNSLFNPMALFAVALYPSFHWLGSFIMSETLFLPAYALGLGWWKRFYNSANLKDGLLFELAFGCAHLARPIFWPAHVMLLLFMCVRFRRHRTTLVWLAVSGTVTILMLAPWAVRNLNTFGRLCLETKSGFVFWWANNPMAYSKALSPETTQNLGPMPPPDFSGTRNELERSQRTWGYFKVWLKEEPGQFLFLC